MLEKCFNDDSNTVCLATPYLEYSNKQDELLNRKISLKIYSLLVLKWAKKDNIFDESLLKYINSMNVEKKQLLYEILLSEIDDEKDILTELKRRRRNV